MNGTAIVPRTSHLLNSTGKPYTAHVLYRGPAVALADINGDWIRGVFLGVLPELTDVIVIQQPSESL